MNSYYLALAGLSMLLLGLALALVVPAWQAHRARDEFATEHTLVVSSSIAIICAALVATAVGQAFGWLALLSAGSAVIRATLLTMLLYLHFRKP